MADLIKGITETGFKFTLFEDVLDDMELLELLVGVDKDPSMIPSLIEKLIGPKQKKRLYDHVRDSKGKVSVTRVTKELESIFTKAGQLKN